MTLGTDADVRVWAYVTAVTHIPADRAALYRVAVWPTSRLQSIKIDVERDVRPFECEYCCRRRAKHSGMDDSVTWGGDDVWELLGSCAWVQASDYTTNSARERLQVWRERILSSAELNVGNLAKGGCTGRRRGASHHKVLCGLDL